MFSIMKYRWDWTAQEIKVIFFFRLLAHLKSRLARGKNYHLFGGHMKKFDRGTEIWKNLIPILAVFSTEAQRQQTEYTGCVSTGGKKDVTHPWKLQMSHAKEIFIGSLQC